MTTFFPAMSDKGPVNKVLKMLPMLKPAYELYPRICDDKGLSKA